MATARVERRLSAILAADVVGYSRLMERDEAGTFERLKRLRKDLIEPVLEQYGGRFVDLKGDGAIVEFGSVISAVEAAVEIQQAMLAQDPDLPESERIRYRIGINLGDVIIDGDTIYGDGVNVAARIESLCEPGGVWLSRSVYNQVRGKVDLALVPSGLHQVKNISEAVETFRVALDGIAPAPPIAVRPWGRRWMLPAAGILSMLIVTGGAWLFWPGEQPSKQRPGIAVLPFANLGGDEATGRLADGITEDIITDLARFQDLDVIARNSTEVYKGKPADIRQVGKELSVGYVLEGSIQRQADQVRVTAMLIDAETGTHVWSERWDRPAGDVFAVQAEIADDAAARIGGWGLVQQADHAKARRKPPGSLTAYDLTVRAREAKQKYTKEQSEEAIRLATRAIEVDPNYAKAYVTRSEAHTSLAMVTGDFASAQPHIEADARKAVMLDPNDAEAHAALGEALGGVGRLAEAKAEFERALALNPSSADLAIWFAAYSGNLGEPERGAAIVDRAIRLNPRFPMWYRNAMREAYFFSGRFEDAVRAILGRDDGSSNVADKMLLAAAYGHLGDMQNARRAAEALLKDVPSFSAELGFNFSYFFIRERERSLFVEGFRKAGLRVCALRTDLASYPNAVRLPECMTP
jgi:TolB-like protein/class 3 adenylate cyclase